MGRLGRRRAAPNVVPERYGAAPFFGVSMPSFVLSPAPDFTLPGVRGGEVAPFSLAQHRGRWVALAFYPRDTSSVCSSEMPVFQQMLPELDKRDVVFVVASTQDIDGKRAWAEQMGTDRLWMLADVGGTVAEAYSVLLPSGVTCRATFLIDPEGVVKWANVQAPGIGRNTDELLRMIDALQTGQACNVNWRKV